MDTSSPVQVKDPLLDSLPSARSTGSSTSSLSTSAAASLDSSRSSADPSLSPLDCCSMASAAQQPDCTCQAHQQRALQQYTYCPSSQLPAAAAAAGSAPSAAGPEPWCQEDSLGLSSPTQTSPDLASTGASAVSIASKEEWSGLAGASCHADSRPVTADSSRLPSASSPNIAGSAHGAADGGRLSMVVSSGAVSGALGRLKSLRLGISAEGLASLQRGLRGINIVSGGEHLRLGI